MKLKIVAKIFEKVFGIMPNEPRADMYLPDRLCAMALALLIGGIVAMIVFAFTFAVWAVVVAIVLAELGVSALLCWKNQTIHIVSDEEFTYTTMFGNTYTYAFADIQGLRRNQDSMTLFVADRKVHIESMAILSDRLVERVNRALAFDQRYIRMSASELLELADEELMYAVWTRTAYAMIDIEDFAEAFGDLNEEQRLVYAVYHLDMEVNNGGLCQFFVNYSRITAPLLSEYLGAIGAVDHQELYDAFIERHQIDTSDLSSFDCETAQDFGAQYERYPFEEYDEAFGELKPLSQYLAPFIKEHIEKF